MTATGLIWVSTPRATVGLVVADGRVVDCPPYARRWAMGRDAEAVRAEQEASGATVKWFPDAEVWSAVCGTGHRDPANPDWCRQKAEAGAIWLRDTHGTRIAISGLARGWDTWWAKAALAAGMEMWAFCPGTWQADPWPESAKREWRELRDRATRVLDFGPTYAKKWFHVRDQAMLDESQAAFTCYDPATTSGGTYETVKKAERMGRPLVWLDPAAMVNRGVVTSVLRQEAALW